MIYFKKDYKLLIHSITLQQQLRSTYYSQQCANYTSIPNATFNINVNNIVQITTIDRTNNQGQKGDFLIDLHLSHFAKGIKNELALVQFHINQQKIIAPSSVNFYTQNLVNRKGTIEYKFISLKTKEISQEQVIKFNQRRVQILKVQQQLAENTQLKRLVQILDAKDEVIKTLERKIISLIDQTRRLNQSLDDQHSQQKKKLKKGLNLNLNINSTNSYHLQKINQKLEQQNSYLQKRIHALQQDRQMIQKKMYEAKFQNNALQIQMKRKQSSAYFGQKNSGIHNKKLDDKQHKQQLQRRSKLTDSMFLNNQNSDSMSNKQRNRSGRKSTTIYLRDSQQLKQNKQKSVGFNQYANKYMDNQQVSQQLRKLKEQVDPDDPNRFSKLQTLLKSSLRMIQLLADQKTIVERKLKMKQDEVTYINAELEKSKLSFKNFQKQLRQRTSKSKNQFQQRMAAIKIQTELRVSQMRKSNKFSQYESVMQQQKRQIQLQKIRFESESLRQKYQQAEREIKSLQQQHASVLTKQKALQTSITLQKQMYKAKYYEAKTLLNKYEPELQDAKLKASMYDTHTLKIQTFQSSIQEVKRKLENQEKQKLQLLKKCKRYQDKFLQVEPQWDRYRKIQNDYDLLKQRHQVVSKLNQRFQPRMEELKKFALRLQNAYYEKKNKHNQHQFDENYQRQMQERIQQVFKKLKSYQRQFYEQQQKQLGEHKRQIIQFFYKRLNEELQKIDQNPNDQKQKPAQKKQKQGQITLLKQQKLQQIDIKIRTYDQQLSQLMQTQDYLPKSLNDKILYLEEKLRKFHMNQFGSAYISQSSHSHMKSTINKLHDQVKQKDSQLVQLKKNMGKMSDSSGLLRVSNIQSTFANQRKSMIEQMAKSRQVFSKSFEDLKRTNAQLLKQKSNLQIELQNYKFKQEKLMLKHQQRQRQLQRVSKKTTQQFKKRISELQKSLQKKSDQNIKNKFEKQQFKQNMSNLIGQLNSTATLLQQRQQDLLALQSLNQQLKVRIQQYQQAERSLLDEVRNIKQQAEFNQKEFKSLLSQRNQHFVNIQRLKNVQIQKLTRMIQQLEAKIQNEVTQVLSTKKQVQILQQNLQKLQSQLEQTKISYNVVNQNYVKVQQDSVLRINQLQQTNQLLQKNLMQMAQTLKSIQLQLHQSHIHCQSLQKQIQSLQSIKNQLSHQQQQYNLELKRYVEIIEEQNNKLNQVQNKYSQISSKVYQVQAQNKTLSQQVIQKQSEYDNIREKLDKKYDQFNLVKSEKFDLQHKLKETAQQFQVISKQKQIYQLQIAKLQDEMSTMQIKLQNINKNAVKQQQFEKSSKILRLASTKGLKPPPRTLLMNSNSKINIQSSENQRQTRNNNSIRQSRSKDMENSISIIKQELKQQNPHKRQMVQSIINNQNNLQSSHQFELDVHQPRQRMWTVRQNDQDLLHSGNKLTNSRNKLTNSPNKLQYSGNKLNHSGDKINHPANKLTHNPSKINVAFSEQVESLQAQDLQSQMSKRNKQQNFKHAQQSDAQKSNIFDQNQWKQAESVDQSKALQEYAQMVKQLRAQVQQLAEQNQLLKNVQIQLNEKVKILGQNIEVGKRNELLDYSMRITDKIIDQNRSQRKGTQRNIKYQNELPNGSLLNVLPTQPNAFMLNQGSSIKKSNMGIRRSSSLSPNLINNLHMPSGMTSKKNLQIGSDNSLIDQSPSTSQRGRSIVKKNTPSQGRSKSKHQASIQILKQRRQSAQDINNSQFLKQQTSLHQSHHFKHSQQKILNTSQLKNLQLLVQQLTQQNKGLKTQLQQEQDNNKKLMQQLQIQQQNQQNFNQQRIKRQQYIDQIKDYYENIKSQLQHKIQEIVQQQINKQQQDTKLFNHYQQLIKSNEYLQKKIQSLQSIIQNLNQQILKQTIQKNQAFKQYRKYEQESELKILKLRQTYDHVLINHKNKQNQVQLIAQDYFALQSKSKSLHNEIISLQQLISKKDDKIKDFTKINNQLIEDLRQTQQSNKKLKSQIHELDQQKFIYIQKSEQTDKSYSMILSKQKIQQKSSQIQKQRMKQKLKQKQQIIQSLKHQIGLYNNETQKLNDLNKQLALQLQRTQKQLKEIMTSYEDEFKQMNLNIKSISQEKSQYLQLIKQKDQQINKNNRIIKRLQEQTQQAYQSQKQTKLTYQKFKSAKQKQINQLNTQFQMLNDQLLKVKSTYQRQSQDFFTKQSDYLKRLSLAEETKRGFKQKMLKYQSVLQQLQKQLITMSTRPTNEEFQQVQFENELLKNRIQQLQQMLREFAPQHQSNPKHDAIIIQYKKYRLQKQKQIQDLNHQFSKYQNKIHQLEEANYIMKRQIDRLNVDLHQLTNENQRIYAENQDLKEDYDQAKKEMQFYKGKRIENLGKLLNDTR